METINVKSTVINHPPLTNITEKIKPQVWYNVRQDILFIVYNSVSEDIIFVMEELLTDGNMLLSPNNSVLNQNIKTELND